MTKQISRDDVAKVCESLCSPDLCCPCRDFRHDTAAMLRSLMDRVEKAEKQCAYSWVVIANSFGGDWSKASSEWQDMARACEWPRPAEIEELWRGKQLED